MWKSLVMVLFIMGSARAETMVTSVIKISEAKRNESTHLVMLSSHGRVGFVDASRNDLLQKLKASIKTKKKVALAFDADGVITRVSVTKTPVAAHHRPKKKKKKKHHDHPAHFDNPDSDDDSDDPYSETDHAPYVPTALSSYQQANEIFAGLNRNTQGDSQCYNRAEVWAYEEFTKRDLHSKKVFLFFTEKYIRNYRYKWWFHVAPFTYVSEKGTNEEYVLDRTFSRQPEKMKTWTDRFIRPRTPCPEVSKYSDYSEHEEESLCYTIKRPMYFWQPQDIEWEENHDGEAKTEFEEFDVNWAYEEAFTRR